LVAFTPSGSVLGRSSSVRGAGEGRPG
jgi:hypothetical protein